jgi:CRP-like cAMP-binding protein
VRTDYLPKIAAITKERTFEEGAVLFEQGSPPDAFHLIVEGRVRLLWEGEETRVGHPGDAVGALAVLDRNPNPLTAVAVGPTRTLYIEDEVLNDLMMDNPAIMLGLIRFLAGEMRSLQAVSQAQTAVTAS